MPGIRVAAGEQRGLVERRGDDAVDLAFERERNGSLDGAPRESTGGRRGARRRSTSPSRSSTSMPAPRGPTKTRSAASRTSLDAAAFSDDLRTDAAHVTERDGEPRDARRESCTESSRSMPYGSCLAASSARRP